MRLPRRPHRPDRGVRVLALTLIAVVACTKDEPPPPAPATVPTSSGLPANQQVAALASCKTEFACPPLDALVAVGAPVGPALLAYFRDPRTTLDQRRLAAIALGKIKFAEAGPVLVAAAEASTGVAEPHDLYLAAGNCGGDATFAALTAGYERADYGSPSTVEICAGLRALPSKSMTWARDKLFAVKASRGAAKDPLEPARQEVKYALVIEDVATPADRDTVVALVDDVTHPAPKRTLAKTAISIGASDDRLFDLLIAGLDSEDSWERYNAGDDLAPIADKIPVRMRPKVITLIKKALAKQRSDIQEGGLTKTLATLTR